MGPLNHNLSVSNGWRADLTKFDFITGLIMKRCWFKLLIGHDGLIMTFTDENRAQKSMIDRPTAYWIGRCGCFRGTQWKKLIRPHYYIIFVIRTKFTSHILQFVYVLRSNNAEIVLRANSVRSRICPINEIHV